MTSSAHQPPHPRTFTRTLVKMPPSPTEYRLTVAHRPGGILACNLYVGRRAQRGPYVEQHHVDTWYADSPLVVVRTLEDAREMIAEAIVQQRLPGID